MPQHSSRKNGPPVRTVVEALGVIAPTRLAAAWDNVGLLAGDLDASCGRVLLTIDMTPAVLAEARRLRSDMIVAYHPPIFRPIKTLRAQSNDTESLVYQAVSRGQAVYALHTALDAAKGGTNDVLADLCELRDAVPFDDARSPERRCKVVAFVPPGDATRVADAMFAAGAGRIGEYEQCGFSQPGTGTFFGGPETQPAVGRKGRRESVDELRLEVVCPAARVGDVLVAIRAAHSYEEPAIDVYPLTPEPIIGAGMGRVGALPKETTLSALASRLKRKLKLPAIEVIGSPKRTVSTAAVCAGSAGRLPFESPRARGADVVVTGEIHHHDRLTYVRLGKAAVVLGHCNSERPVLPHVQDRLAAAVPKLTVRIADADGPPAAWR